MQTPEDVLAACRGYKLGDSETFHAVIASTLVVLGLLQVELAAYLKVTPPTISRWMSGKHAPQARIQASVLKDVARRITYTLQHRERRQQKQIS